MLCPLRLCVIHRVPRAPPRRHRQLLQRPRPRVACCPSPRVPGGRGQACATAEPARRVPSAPLQVTGPPFQAWGLNSAPGSPGWQRGLLDPLRLGAETVLPDAVVPVHGRTLVQTHCLQRRSGRHITGSGDREARAVHLGWGPQPTVQGISHNMQTCLLSPCPQAQGRGPHA